MINYDKLCKCGYKKINNKDYCCFMCSIEKGHGNKCCGRENNTIIFGSEGCGYSYSYFFINYLIYLYNPNISIIFNPEACLFPYRIGFSAPRLKLDNIPFRIGQVYKCQ